MMNPSPDAASILVVDDIGTNVRLLELLLSSEGYRVHGVTSGMAALDAVATEPPDLILLDVMMPCMNGFEVTQQLKSNPATRHIPVILVTAMDEEDTCVKGLAVGAEDFVSKPINKQALLLRVRNLLRLKEYSDFLANHNQRLEKEVNIRTEELRNSYADTIYLLTRAAERRDVGKGSHIKRIGYYCQMLAVALGLDEHFQEQIFFASALHDIGKIGIPDAILLKQGPLSAEEWQIMYTHTTIGAQILAGSNTSYIAMAKDIAQSHHEHWDGSGYPKGLLGDAIPLAARIMSLCDVYDTLRSSRPYKKSIDHAKALKIIFEGDERTHPSYFDPTVLAAFTSVSDQFAAIYDREATVNAAA